MCFAYDEFRAEMVIDYDLRVEKDTKVYMDSLNVIWTTS